MKRSKKKTRKGMIEMGHEYYCDLCRKILPTESSLTPVSIGGDKIVDVCLNCASVLRNTLKKEAAATQAGYQHALLAAQPAPNEEPENKT